jgi:hypothetical protein
MSSSPNPIKVDPKDIPTLAPEVVVTRADRDVVRPEPDGKSGPAAPDVAAGATTAPVDTSFRATSASPVRLKARKSFGRRLIRGAVGLVLTACVAGAAVFWQSYGEAARQIVMKSLAPVVVAFMSRESPTAEQPSVLPVVQAAVVPDASAPQRSADMNSSAGSPPVDTAELLQSLARELAHMRQEMDQIRGTVAELKASDDQMAREIAKLSDKATDKALEQALRPRVSMASPPPAQPVAMPVRKPPPPPVARPVQARPASASPQVATSYVPRAADTRAAAPPPTAALPPMDLSAPPRPPAAMREQMP